LLRWVATDRSLLDAGGGGQILDLYRNTCHVSRRCEVVLLGFSRDTRTPGAAALGWMVEAAFFFAGDGRPEDGVVGLRICHRVPEARWEGVETGDGRGRHAHPGC
jgi:hypothetical protein